jgi:four helix bundle protein
MINKMRGKGMSKINTYEELPVWQQSHKLVIEVYSASRKFSKEELFVLTAQLRRAAISVPANIVEGFYCDTTKELIKFLYISRGSCGEVLYHLKLAYDLGYLTKEKYQDLRKQYDNIARQLNGWIKSLRAKIND